MKLKCIALDDEPLALGLLVSYIEQTPFLELCGKYSNPIDALNAIYEQDLEVLFLDIQMAGLNGIELARVLNQSKKTLVPRIIFTTAYNNFALEGYRVNALDYLLKPFDYEEFFRAAIKARQYFELINNKAENSPAIQLNGDSLYLKVDYQLIKVSFADIIYIEGAGDYVKVYHLRDGKPIFSQMTLKSLEEKLPAKKFMRVHRSFIVSLDKIESVSRNSIQIGKTTIYVGEQYKNSFKEFLSRWD